MGRQIKADLNEDGTNADGGVEFNVNLGFGSKTIGPLSPPRVKGLVSDWGESGSTSPILGNGSRTEVETPPSELALVLSPPPPFFRNMDEGDSTYGGGTRSTLQAHVHISDSSRTPSRSGVKRSFHPRSHNVLASDTVTMGAVDVADGMNHRAPDRRGVRDLRKVSSEVQHAEFRFSPPDEDKQGKQHETAKTTVVGVGGSNPSNPSPGSFPSDSGIRSCSPTAGSLSPRMEVFSDPEFPGFHSDHDTSRALGRLSPDGLNEMEMHAGECGNDLGGVGDMDGYHPTRRLSAVSVDGSDNGGEFDWGGLGSLSDRVEPFTRVGASQDRNAPGSRCSSISCSTPGSCADADVDSGSRSPPVGPCSPVLPRSRYSGLSSDRGSRFGSRLRHHAKGRTMGNVLSPGSRFHLRVPLRTLMPGSLKTVAPLSSSKPLEAIPYTYDARAFQDNVGLNTDNNTSWSIQTHEHVHTDTREFDTLRFSSSPSTSIAGSASPSLSAPGNPLLDRDKDSEAGSLGPGINGLLPLDRELRSYMKTDMAPDSNTRTGLNGGADGALYSCDTLGLPLTSFINNRGNDDGSVLRHVDGTEHRDMGGLEHESLGPFDLRGRASHAPAPVSGSVSGVSGVSVAGSLFSPVLGAGSRFGDDDTRLPTSQDSRTMSVQSRTIDRGDGEEPEECGLLKSLLESSDPWGLMRKTVLNLPSPTPSEVERRGRKRKEDMVRVRRSLGRRGVGYVTPPSMDALLGVVGSSGEVEVNKVEEGATDDEDSQEVLDFRSSQPCTGHFSSSPGAQSRHWLTHSIHFLHITRYALRSTGALQIITFRTPSLRSLLYFDIDGYLQ